MSKHKLICNLINTTKLQRLLVSLFVSWRKQLETLKRATVALTALRPFLGGRKVQLSGLVSWPLLAFFLGLSGLSWALLAFLASPGFFSWPFWPFLQAPAHARTQGWEFSS